MGEITFLLSEGPIEVSLGPIDVEFEDFGEKVHVLLRSRRVMLRVVLSRADACRFGRALAGLCPGGFGFEGGES